VYPKYVHARAKGNIVEIDSLKTDEKNFRYGANVNVSLRKQGNDMWWDVWDADAKSTDSSFYKPPCKPNTTSIYPINLTRN
jgi:hypothetical protein